MLKLASLVLPIVICGSGCAGSVIFGHTGGESRSDSVTEPASAPNAAPAPATAAGTNAAPAPATAAGTGAAPAPRVHREKQAVTAVALSFTPAAMDKIAADAEFKPAALLTEIQGELRARRLLDEAASGTTRVMAISVDDFATRDSSNAVVFGYKLGSGTLAANITIRDGGKDVRDFRIQAGSRIAGRPGGEDTNPLRPLYHRFAILAVDGLAGTVSTESAGDEVPR
jgi:hypothetical protein